MSTKHEIEMYENPDEDVLLEEEIEEDIGSGFDAMLIVYNDDHNSFEWVIESFMSVLNHSMQQAEQLAMLIHFKGKATVKTAPKRILKPLKDGLVDKGLSAVIEGGDDE